MNRPILPVIMSGGSGTRLWPLSTPARPKQFHTLGGRHTMIAETALRVARSHVGLSFLPPVVIAGATHADLVDTLLAEAGLEASAVVLEPQGRNTAATAALAAATALEIAPDADVLLLPADHVVTLPDAFHEAVKRAAPVVADRIVTFGIVPTAPETGYGYILQGAPLCEGVFAVEKFTEKPGKEVAEAYLAAGGYSWNSGVFYFSPRMMLEEFSIGAAEVRDRALEALRLARRDGRRRFLDAEAFARTPEAPVDVAVMEKTRRAAVAPCSIGWADLGSWSEVWRLSPQDGAGNAIAGSAKLVDAGSNLVYADGVHVSVAGVNDLVIVATRDAVLVLPKDRAQDVKKLIP